MSRQGRIGAFGESAVCRYLEQRGWTILDRNYRIPGGEVDIIARRGDTVAFVEVKTRTTGEPASGFDAVTRAKRRLLSRAARRWYDDREEDCYLRFDAAEVICRSDGSVSIDYLENAFDADAS